MADDLADLSGSDQEGPGEEGQQEEGGRGTEEEEAAAAGQVCDPWLISRCPPLLPPMSCPTASPHGLPLCSNQQGVEDGRAEIVLGDLALEAPRASLFRECRGIEEFEVMGKVDEGTYGAVFRARDK